MFPPRLTGVLAATTASVVSFLLIDRFLENDEPSEVLFRDFEYSDRFEEDDAAPNSFVLEGSVIIEKSAGSRLRDCRQVSELYDAPGVLADYGWFTNFWEYELPREDGIPVPAQPEYLGRDGNWMVWERIDLDTRGRVTKQLKFAMYRLDFQHSIVAMHVECSGGYISPAAMFDERKMRANSP